MNVRIGSSQLELVEGDITQQDVDVIVNAANSSLLGGGGVDGAIHRAAGPALLEECCKVGGCPTGEARITGGGRLAARYVIHAVGPVYRGGTRGEAELLASAFRHSLELATQHGLRSIAFPAISTGVYGYPKEEAAHIALSTIREYLRTHPQIELVRMVLFGPAIYRIFADVLTALLSQEN